MRKVFAAWETVDATDLLILAGFACLVAGVALRYDFPLALIVTGLGLLALGGGSLWRPR